MSGGGGGSIAPVAFSQDALCTSSHRFQGDVVLARSGRAACFRAGGCRVEEQRSCRDRSRGDPLDLCTSGGFPRGHQATDGPQRFAPGVRQLMGPGVTGDIRKRCDPALGIERIGGLWRSGNPESDKFPMGLGLRGP